MKQLCNVVMLPTEKASDLCSLKEDTQGIDWKSATNDNAPWQSKGTLFFKQAGKSYHGMQNQHLYITSDEEIKEGDWVYWELTSDVFQFKKLDCTQDYIKECKKVIATTDKFLGEPQLPLSDAWRDWFKNRLPQIPESFIKAFVESNGTIKEVLVEYEECQTFKDDACGVRFGCCNSPIKLKTRSDNTIILSQAKTYTRDEVLNYSKKCFELVFGRVTSLAEDKIIEDNL